MTSSAIAELDRPSRVACSDLLGVIMASTQNHLQKSPSGHQLGDGKIPLPASQAEQGLRPQLANI